MIEAPSTRPAPPDDRDAPFRRRTLLVIAVGGGLSLLATLGALVFEPRDVPAALIDDRSALGFDTLVALLDEAGVPMRALAADEHPGDTDELLVLVPPGDPGPAQIRRMRARSFGRRTLLVLPKWTSEPDDEHPGWVRDVIAARERSVEHLLKVFVLGNPSIERVRAPYAEHTRSPSLDADLPYPQLLSKLHFEPILSDERGVLVGRPEMREAKGDLIVLADVDLIDNHGIVRGSNATIVRELFDELRDGEGVVFDESIRLARDPSDVWGRLLEPPLAHGLVQLGLLAVVVLWSAGRFGAPRPLREGLDAGSGPLVASTAELLLVGGHDAAMLQRYEHLAHQQVAEHLTLPAQLATGERAQRLRAVLRARGQEPLEPFAADASDAHTPGRAELLRRARRIHHWRESVFHGHR